MNLSLLAPKLMVLTAAVILIIGARSLSAKQFEWHHSCPDRINKLLSANGVDEE